MRLPKIKEVLALTLAEIEEEILDSKKELFNLRLKKGSQQGFNPAIYRHLKHRISQLLMVKKQRESKKDKTN